MTQSEFLELKSLSDVCRFFGWPINGNSSRKAKKFIESNGFSTDHFDNGASKRKSNNLITKTCPVCSKEFSFRERPNRKGKTTCSRACANTHFRSGESHPNWKLSAYRTTCFLHHKKACVVCGEENIVDVHHYDHDRTNNNPENLIPLCPTHHVYIHSSFAHLVEDIVDEYRKKFIEKT